MNNEENDDKLQVVEQKLSEQNEIIGLLDEQINS